MLLLEERPLYFKYLNKKTSIDLPGSISKDKHFEFN